MCDACYTCNAGDNAVCDDGDARDAPLSPKISGGCARIGTENADLGVRALSGSVTSVTIVTREKARPKTQYQTKRKEF
jgi:hypothetical protein